MRYDFAVVIPMANESAEFNPFISDLIDVLNKLESGTVYLIYILLLTKFHWIIRWNFARSFPQTMVDSLLFGHLRMDTSLMPT